MLRDVLGELGGIETTAPRDPWDWGDDHEVYVIPAARWSAQRRAQIWSP